MGRAENWAVGVAVNNVLVRALDIGTLDRRILRAIDHHRQGWLDDVTKALTYVGTTPWTLALCALAALLVFIWLRAFRPGVAAVVALVLANQAAHVLKAVYDRPRPPTAQALVHVGGASFPSTHAAMTSAVAVALYLAVSWRSRRAARLAAAALTAVVAFIGFCLVYVGSHWVSDVIAGWALGSVIGAAVGLAIRRLWRRADPAPSSR